MINTYLTGLILFAVSMVCFNATAQIVPPSRAYGQLPVQHLLVTASYIQFENERIIPDKHQRLKNVDLNGDLSNLPDNEQGALIDLKVAYGKIAKVKTAVNYFRTFYIDNYAGFKDEEKLTPQEMLRLIEHLTWFKNYFDLLSKRKYLTKILRPYEVEELEILILKNTALIENLSLEIQRILRSVNNKPEKQKLFDGIEISKLRTSEDSIASLSHVLSRLATLETYAKSCFGLF